jgi:hypothetical protein
MGILDVDDADTIEGQGEALDKVHRFIKNIQESVEMEGGFIFSLFKSGRAESEEDPVFTSELEVDGSAGELANEIVNAAMEDAGEYYKGNQKYVVRAENVKARCLFTLYVKPGEEDEDMEDVEDLPNKKGLLSQLMRHQEKIMKVAVGTVGKITDQLMKSNREKDDRIRELEAGQVNTIKLTEELISGRHARDLELRKVANKEKRSEEVVGMLMQSAPMVLGMIANSQAGNGAPPPAQMGEPNQFVPQQSSHIEPMVEALLGSFTTEQFEEIAKSGVFAPQQIMALVEIAKAVKAKQDAVEAAARAAAQASANATGNAVANGPV